MALSLSGDNNPKPLHIIFLHLDLGIGGAEQLVVNLALASLPDSDKHHGPAPSLDARVSIFTTHCNQNHCFDAVRRDPPGKLARSVHVVGAFLPVAIMGMGTALCSTIRMMYLGRAAMNMHPDADVFVLDVLPTPMPYLVLRAAKSVIYYCHFPDKLLTRDTVNGEAVGQPRARGGIKAVLKRRYRHLLDRMEEWTMSYADLICVNSNFTKTEVLRAFPSLKCRKDSDRETERSSGNRDGDACMQVLYPAIDLSKFIPPNFAMKEALVDRKGAANRTNGDDTSAAPIVSLNRFERKKNIEILLHAYASLRQAYNRKGGETNLKIPMPPLTISGGYDPRNTENVEYLTELKILAKSLGIEENTRFRPSVSDEERAALLQSAICLVYTPHREHFGIVPLEAMYAGSAVIAIKSGGPKETVLDGITGILVDMAPGDSCDKLADAIGELLVDPKRAIEMGKRGHEHVKERFGLGPFRQEWKRLVEEEAIPRGLGRKDTSDGGISGITKMSALLIVLVAWWYYLVSNS